jgi:hypothetical protein
VKRKVIAALLFDHFHITPEQYARLTDRQIFDLFLHARKSDGSIDFEVPFALKPKPMEEAKEEKPHALESEMAALDELAKHPLFKIDAAELQELKVKLQEKYARTAAGSAAPVSLQPETPQCIS